MITLVYGQSTRVAEWSAAILGLPFRDKSLSAIGVADDGDLIAGIVFTNYTKHPHSIEASVASTTPRWATRRILRDLFCYPFVQVGVDRLEARCATDDARACEFAVKLGLQFEGIKRKGYPTGCDAAMYSMLRNECFWLKVNHVSHRSAA